jgi:hypothetical protein
MLGNSVEAAPFAFFPDIFGIGSEPVKAALTGALVSALTGSGQCSTQNRGRRRELLGVEAIQTSSLSARSSPEFYTRKIRDLIRRMSKDNPGWGAPRIHGELLKLGINIGETSVSKYLVRNR